MPRLKGATHARTSKILMLPPIYKTVTTVLRKDVVAQMTRDILIA